jgi:hypothetical protein
MPQISRWLFGSGVSVQAAPALKIVCEAWHASAHRHFTIDAIHEANLGA